MGASCKAAKGDRNRQDKERNERCRVAEKRRVRVDRNICGARLASRFVVFFLALSIINPFAILLTFLGLNIRFGQGYFAYRYSPVRELRVPRAAFVLPIGLLACGAVWFLAQSRRRLIGMILFAAVLCLSAVWSFWLPPQFMTQQMYGMTSPSCDGAFVVEARFIDSIPAYLRAFNERLHTSIEEMKGTRVLSNPPGMTVLADVVMQTSIGREWVNEYLVERENIDLADAPPIGNALRVGMALCAVWAVSGFFAYGLGRVFLSPAGAAVFAILVTFNPCALEFVPGKDPAQLLTINAMLWAWFVGWKRGSRGIAALAGAIFVFGCTFSLVHIWVAAIAGAACLWEALAARKREALVSTAGAKFLTAAISMAAGALAVVLAAYVAIGWNIPSTLWAVSRRWGEIQKTFDMNRAVWYAIGLPIFLLFLAPGTWTLAAMSLRRRRLNLGTRLALCTIAVMLFIYFVVGVTYELPRLWVAFLPPLMLGLCIDRPLLRGKADDFFGESCRDRAGLHCCCADRIYCHALDAVRHPRGGISVDFSAVLSVASVVLRG